MDQSSLLVSQLLAVAEAERQPAAAVTLLPLIDLAREALGGAGDQAAGIAAELTAVATGRRSLADGCAAAAEHLSAAEAGAEQRAMAERYAALGALIDRALTLRQILASELLARAEVLLTDVSLFRVIRTIAIAGAEGELHIIGTPPLSAGTTTVTFARQAVLDRVQVSYERDSPLPRLTVMTASMAESAEWATTRHAWQQLDVPEYNLQLLNSRSRDLGVVTTQRASLPWTAQTGSRTIALQDGAANHVLITTVADTLGLALARCVRVIPAK